MRALVVGVIAVAACGGDRAVRPEPPDPEGEGEVVIVAPVDAAPAVGPSDPFELGRPRPTVVTSTSITVLDPVTFIGVSARLDPRSLPMLDQVATTITGDPTIRELEVRAYGDDAPVVHQQELGRQRALAIVAYLAYRGVEPARLSPVGVAGQPPSPGARTQFLIVRN